ncbi:putative RNA-directed RNA polymerase (Sad-1) [Aspergillus clavatus NRRL 1]|uniref:RNA-dependent RNA polymerase n=1 Tax=Aspergillus clavatus (strain ATCC 1007 / CBS 513.65 / DSM 816 / NCTC 3887 / NRRL 1 / QM 1276 / 107) TaxID=344612 RepID=A1CJE9_ASPCL|nr:RNA-directed RNA polymerase (Sad-1), putative [Aspergillus clavatus NRRL 1]EAW09273.1 RNA-directed RNA polymerase (Sad-1), putative [Aspergillus clavatus NRRL 1]
MTRTSRSRKMPLQEGRRAGPNTRQNIPPQSSRNQISSQNLQQNTRQKTPLQAPRRQQPLRASRHPAALNALWKQWESVAVNLFNLPPETDAYTVWQAFSKEGRVLSIDIFEDIHGNKESKGKLRFKPPPQRDFWRAGTYQIVLQDGTTKVISVALDPKQPDIQVQSPVRSSISYPAEVIIPIASMDIGVQIDGTTMLPMRTVGGGMDEHVHAVLDLKRRDMFIFFQLPIFNARRRLAPTNESYNQYRLRLPFVQLAKLHQMQDAQSGMISHLTFLDSPAIYHRRIQETRATFTDDISWRDSDSWYRQTSVVHNPGELSVLPVSLKRLKPVVDIGRWNAFRITYPRDINDKGKFLLFCNILRDYNIFITKTKTNSFSVLDYSRERAPPIWKWIDYTDSQTSKAFSSLEELIDETYVHLPFPVRYQLEVCISHNYLSEFTMTRGFAIKLSGLGEAEALRLLEHVATKKEVFHNPMKIFDLKFVKGVTHAKIPSYCCYMRSARITPTTIYYNTPSVDISNRVIRHYIEFADRFLRVRFTDEKLFGRINSTMDDTMDEVFTRIKRALANGIVVGDRRYEFLAFGNSQFREHGAYFFAPLPNLTAANIRAWMGTFNDIRNVAKHAARLGQCFSTTRAISGCPVQIHKIDDVVRNGYTFSDGVGRISRFLAQMVASELKIKTPIDEPPSAFQFRLGGCKGMLTVSPEAQRHEVHIRKSQYKFAAAHNGLEIIRWSQFSMATLNRQLIIVLSSLGIPDQVFHEKLQAMLRSLNEAMESDSQAIYWLKKYVDPNQMTLTVSQMVLDGFRRTQEPFVTSVLRLWRAWHLKYLKEKAKIAIDKGANLLGCMDETGILKGYFENVPAKDAPREKKLTSLPEVFVQILHPESGKYQIIEGVCILARNPSLHPGDIRVVRAVNVPELSHLKDVVVFPQTGDRDVPSMCSGGDLDGDDYLVIWDQDLIPKDWFRIPMKYTSDKAQDLNQDVTVDHITSFFVIYMKNDFLPRIAHAHLAWADRLEYGVNEGKCIRLAQLHSDAVDYNKTGRPANMTRSLQPKMWPHFMEKKHKPKERIYRSGKILGQLYDAVERVDFVPSLEMPFDERILKCRLQVSDDLMQTARDLKADYDAAMHRIMAQHEIRTEFEVWSTFVLSHANMSKDYKFHEELGMLSLSLRGIYRKKCYEKVGGRSFELLAPLAVAMYRVTHEEMTTALQKYRAENPHDEKLFHKPTPKIDQLPFISFPWVLQNILGKVAMGLYDEPEPAPAPAPFVAPAAAAAATTPAEVGNLGVDPKGAASNAREDTTGTQVTHVPPNADPFGLFEGDVGSGTSPQLATESSTENRRESILSLDQLLDFGLMDSGVPLALTKRSQASVPTPAPDGLSLLELGDNSENVKPVQEDEVKLGPGNVDSKGVCIDIVEEEDEVQPTAFDMLNEILNG